MRNEKNLYLYLFQLQLYYISTFLYEFLKLFENFSIFHRSKFSKKCTRRRKQYSFCKRHPHTIFSGMVKGRVIFYSIEWLNFVRHKSFLETFKCSIITIPTILNTLSYRSSTDRLHPYQDSWFPCLVRILIPMWIVDSKESSKLVKILSRMKERENGED